MPNNETEPASSCGKTEKIFFRENPTVAALARDRAHSLGLSLSDYMRLLLRNSVGLSLPGDIVNLRAMVKSIEEES